MALPEQYISMTHLEEETASTLVDNKRFVMFDEEKSRSASLEDIKDHILGDMNNVVEQHNSKIQEMNSKMTNFADELEVDDEGLVWLLNNGDRIAGPYGPFAGGGGGGGGGSTNNAVLSLMNTSGWLSKSIAEGASCPISFTWSSTEDDIPTGNGILTVRINGSVRINRSVAQGETEIDISGYLTSGANAVRVTISDVYSNNKSINYTVSIVTLSIKSSFDATVPKTGSFAFTYIPVGNIEKTVYFILDDVVIDTVVTSVSGRQLTYTVPMRSHGAHSFLVYFEAEVNGDIIKSNELYYDIIYVDSSATTPIIASNFREETTEQYTTLKIPYIVYNPSSLTSEIRLYVDDKLVSTQFVGRTEQVWSYRADKIGVFNLKIQCGLVSKEFNITVTKSEIVAEVTTENMVLSLQSAGRSNAEENPDTWVYKNIKCIFSGFNHASNGWVFDDNGNTVLRVNGTARLTIPYQPFAEDFRNIGKTIEIDFATKDVVDYDAVILSCMSGNRGIMITAQNAIFKSAESSISTQYKEDEHIRLTFVIEKRSENRLLMAYINSVPSAVIQYSASDSFLQIEPVDISIGAAGCTMDIYSIRIYDNNLTRNQVLDNWIADEQDVNLILQRYSHNDVYDAYGNIVISKLPKDLPYMILEAPQLPQYKGDKKTISGSYVDPVNSANSFTFTGCQINVQGTSSAPYARKNYDLQFKQGFEMNEGHEDNFALHPDVIPFNRFVLKADVASSEGANNVELVKLFNDTNPFKSREQIANPKVRQGIYGFPIVVFWTNTTTGTTSFLGKYNFNLPKRAPGPYGYSGDMESWEFQNNTSNLMLFKSDYFSMAPITDPDTGDTKEAWRYDYEARFPSDEWTNIDKLQEFQSFIYSTYRENATGNTLTTPVTYTETHVEYIENVDPDTGAISYEERLITEDITYSTDTAAYRLARFKNEFPTYAELNSFIFYYIFTELFLMVDSRAKNLFIGFNGSDVTAAGRVADRKAVAQPYDMDTAIGTNNEGSLVFGYGLEDTDYLTGGANIFNGQDSVLWCNLRDSYKSEITEMYKNLRSNGILSFDYVERKFEEHQSKWPEAIWIEDAWFKYIDPLIAPDPGKEPTAVYLPMMQGSKEEQRKWWLSNRFRYMDSKWIAGDAVSQEIQLRGYSKANITVTPHTDIYPTIKYGSYVVQKRGQHGQPTVLECPIDDLNDTEIYIYSAPQIASVGDLSGLQVGFADFSKAIRLRNIKLGDSSNTYKNYNLNSLTFGNNKLLQTVDVRNCVELGKGPTTILELQNCDLIENVYCEGTQLQGVSLPNGGILKVLHLPETTTNLTIRNQPNITDLSIPSYENISKLILENVPTIDTRAILNQIPVNTEIWLTGFRWEVQSAAEIDALFDRLDTMRGCTPDSTQTYDKAQVQGTIHIDYLTGSQIAAYGERYPYITIDADTRECEVTYLNAVGEIYHQETVVNGHHATFNGQPSKTPTVQYDYVFAGWSERNDNIVDPNAQKFILKDRTLYPCYTTVTKSYTIVFRRSDEDGGGVLYTQENVLYGEIPVYRGETPTTIKGDAETWPFYGWSPVLEPAVGNMTYTAIFKDTSPMTRILVSRTPLEAFGSMSLIGTYAFGYCSQLNTASFVGVEHIGDSAFYGCPSLTTMVFPNVSTIGSYAFADCNGLKSVAFPKVTSMNRETFRGCYNLTSVNFPLLTSVPPWAFMYCYNLTSVSFPDATTIENYAFGYCGLSSITLSNVVTIKECGFVGCESLRTINFPNVRTIDYDAFGNCYRLSDVRLPNVTSISTEVFASCRVLMSVNLPRLQTLGQSAFASCSNLTNVSFPAVTTIGSNAFIDCYYLRSVYLLTSSVARLANVNAFTNTPMSTTYQGTPGTIYVRASLVNDYKNTEGWTEYASRIVAYEE